MKTKLMLITFALSIVLVCMFMSGQHPMVAKYGSVPKGVVVEGQAQGFEQIVQVQFDAQRNVFTINGKSTYQNPVTAAEWRDIATAVQFDTLMRVGVSVVADRSGKESVITYGLRNPNSTVAKKLADCDYLLRAVIFGRTEFLPPNSRLPGNYVPKTVEHRKITTICYLKMSPFIFRKDGNQYLLSQAGMDAELIPIHPNSRAPDGGYLPDYDALEAQRFEREDLENVRYFNQYRNDIMRMPVVDAVVKIGEAASFARLLKVSGIDLTRVQ